MGKHHFKKDAVTAHKSLETTATDLTIYIESTDKL